MTRMWLDVEPAKMCTEHIKRELREMSQLCEIARGEWEPPTWENDGSTAVKKLLGHATKGQIDTRYIGERWEALWDELDRRDETLDLDRSQPEYPDVLPDLPGATVNSGPANEAELANRCSKCQVLLS